jgi:AraC family transcriptional regulator
MRYVYMSMARACSSVRPWCCGSCSPGNGKIAGMVSHDSRAEYTKRMHRVLEYIDSHLAQRRATQRDATGAFESDSNPDQVASKPDQALARPTPHHEYSREPPQEILMKVTLIERQPARVAYLRHVGPYGQPLFAFWSDVVYPWMATHNLVGKPRYGISYDDPSITAPEKCRYDACVEVPADFMASGQALTTTIPGGKYAATHFRGTAGEIVATWTAILRDWLPSSGMQLDARPCFEYYPTDTEFDAASGAFTCEIVIPVVSL